MVVSIHLFHLFLLLAVKWLCTFLISDEFKDILPDINEDLASLLAEDELKDEGMSNFDNIFNRMVFF